MRSTGGYKRRSGHGLQRGRRSVERDFEFPLRQTPHRALREGMKAAQLAEVAEERMGPDACILRR